MSDCVDDYEATIRLIVQEYFDLRNLNPNHELLSLAEKVDGTGFDSAGDFSERYKCGAEGHKTGMGKATGINTLYYFDLRQAVTAELKKALKKEKGRSEEEIWRTMEERGLVGVIRTYLTENKHPLMDFVN